MSAIYADSIKTLSRLMLDTSITPEIKKRFSEFKKVVWGAGESGKTFITLNKDIGFDYIVDTRENLQGTTHEGLSISSEQILFAENRENTLVFLPTVIHQKLKAELLDKGFKYFVVPNQINASGVGFSINRNDIMLFIDWINENNINYVFQKYITEEADFFKMRDFDILVATEDIPKIIQCPVFLRNQTSDVISVDVMWSHPIGVSQELPFYTEKLSTTVLNKENQVFLKNVRAVKIEFLIYMYFYHIILHKGDNEAIEKYRNVLGDLMSKLSLNVNLDLESIYNFIQQSEFAIPIDFARKWADKTQSDFLNEKTRIKPLAQQTLAVFIFREFFRENQKLLQDSLDIIETNGFKIAKKIVLEGGVLENVTKNIRGGVWIDSNHTLAAGGPYKAIICTHSGIDSRKAKVEIRDYITKVCGREINCIHASDDDVEAIQFLHFLNEDKNTL